MKKLALALSWIAEIVGATAKPSRLGGSLEAPSITITGSSFSFNGMTCTIVAGAIACS